MIILACALRGDVDALLVFGATPGGSQAAARAKALGLCARAAPLPKLAPGREFAALLQAFRPDVAHIHAGIGWEGHALAAAARAEGIRAVVRTEHLPYTLRELGAPELEDAYARGVAPVDRIICVCDAARRTFGMSGVDPARYTTVHNGVDARRPQCSREEVRARLGLGDVPLILTVARFTEQKRHVTLLDALPRLLRTHPRAHLLWVGSGPLEAMLRERAAALGMAGQVLFMGERPDVPDLMAASDAFCLPSYFEGHPLVVLEAMAAGLPVVAARSLGITEAVRDDETGLLFRFANAPLLAATLARLLDNPSLAAHLARAARYATTRYFTARRMAAQTLQVYRAVLDGHPVQPAG